MRLLMSAAAEADYSDSHISLIPLSYELQLFVCLVRYKKQINESLHYLYVLQNIHADEVKLL